MAPAASTSRRSRSRNLRRLAFVAVSVALVAFFRDLSRVAVLGDALGRALEPGTCGTVRDRLHLGGSLADGSSKTRDKLGLWFDELTCYAGDARGCTHVGRIYDEGWSVTKDSSRATHLYERACSAGDGLGCSSLALDYEVGDGVPVDVGRAAVLYRWGCSLREEFGCYRLASCYERGLGVPRDLARAVELFREACDGGHPLACTGLGMRYETGMTVPAADRQTAVGLYRRGCAGGDQKGCDGLHRLRAWR